MRLSTRGRYALRMMLDIARFGKDGKPVSLSSVAERTDISRGYLEQVAMSLRTANLLKAVSGRFGGFKLATLATEITLGRIIEAAIGPINLVECVANPEDCMRSEECECRQVYDLINRRITDVLDDYTLADLESGAFSAAGVLPVVQTS